MQHKDEPLSKKLNLQKFVVIVLIASVWVNASEVFRYFAIVMPKLREFLSNVHDVLPMNWVVFSIWGVWDTILTTMFVLMFWLVAQCFGNNFKSILIASTASWAFFFLLFWVGMVNMGLSPIMLPFIVLPFAWFEAFVASLIASKLFARVEIEGLTYRSP